jgi:putative methyltransferase (TIGR04325 family)
MNESLPRILKSVGAFGHTTPALALTRWWNKQRFPHEQGMRMGVYDSFEEARAHAPSELPVGFDVDGMEDLFRHRADQVQYYDYPVLFWLSRVVGSLGRVFDLGGHVGVHYFGYRRMLDFPPTLEWTVCEVPVVVRAGVALARERGASCLRFTTEWDGAEGADVLIAAGAIQYLEPQPDELLGRLRNPPAHVLLNKVPIYDGPAYVTLQNNRVSYVPHHVYNKQELTNRLAELGYSLVDEWHHHDRPCQIPGRPERSFSAVKGMYFRRDQPEKGRSGS